MDCTCIYSYQLSLLSLHWLPIAAKGAVYIQDDDCIMTENIELHVVMFTPCIYSTLAAMVVGFTSMRYTARETEGQATVCVDVSNPPNGGALLNFTVALLPEKGVVSCRKMIFFCKLVATEN